jgi:hypothetical protein
MAISASKNRLLPPNGVLAGPSRLVLAKKPQGAGISLTMFSQRIEREGEYWLTLP